MDAPSSVLAVTSSKLVQRQQPLQNLLVGRFGGIGVPAVGRPDRAVGCRVQIREPDWPRIVEIGQRLFLAAIRCAMPRKQSD